jgi:hypothetical protein
MIVYNYLVSGRGYFPTSMLSHDRCWPRLEGDAAKVGAHSVGLLGLRQVQLQGIQPPTRDLWESRDWEVCDDVRQAHV